MPDFRVRFGLDLGEAANAGMGVLTLQRRVAKLAEIIHNKWNERNSGFERFTSYLSAVIIGVAV